jgi:hypothetical protein
LGEQEGDGGWSDAAGHRRDESRLLGRGGVFDAADVAGVVAGVDNHGAGLNPVALDEFGAADGGDNDVGLADSLTPFGGHTSIWVPRDQFGALTVLNDPITPDQSIGNDNTDSPPEPF